MRLLSGFYISILELDFRYRQRGGIARSIVGDPLIVVNFKTYQTAHGASAVGMAQVMTDIEAQCTLIAVLSPFDLSSVVSAAPQLEVWCQHLDPIGFGSNTGWLHPETAIERGASGTLINHAEHKVSIEHVTILLEQVPDEFVVCACAADVEEAKALASLKPEYIAVEPPELIGGEISVTSADPEIISSTLQAVKEIADSVGVLCGAGVKDRNDVSKAIQLGTEGVLLASGVTKAEDPRESLEGLVRNL